MWNAEADIFKNNHEKSNLRERLFKNYHIESTLVSNEKGFTIFMSDIVAFPPPPTRAKNGQKTPIMYLVQNKLPIHWK